MTAKIFLSEIGRAQGTREDYAREVARHVENLNAWHAHHESANPDDFDSGAKGRYPYPDPHSIVHSGVTRGADGTFVADYEIVDDTFEMKKEALSKAVTDIETVYVNKILPPGKLRAWRHRINDILTKPESEHTADDKAFITDQEQRKAATEKMSRHAAQMLSDIEDLTPETIDAWKPSPLKE